MVRSQREAQVRHKTVAQGAVHEEVINGSRFIGHVTLAGTPAAAEELLARVRSEHPDATHHCWAYRVGEAQRFSDDGEPGGTAGRPMLEVILKRDLDLVAAVVVRYYGGRKLGAGGLVRAYSGSVAKALDLAGEREIIELVTLTVRAPFAQVDQVVRLADAIVGRHPDSSRGDVEFDAAGLVLGLTLPKHLAEGARAELTEATRGVASMTAEDAGNTVSPGGSGAAG